MPALIRKVLKPVGYVAGTLVGVAGLYLAAAFVLSRIPVPKADPTASPDVLVFLHTNGVHTDIVVPIKTAQIDWSKQLPFSNIPSGDTTMRFIAFGWGDKGFYLDTPTWADLKFSTAFVAAFWLGSSAMHTTYLHSMVPGPATVPLYLSRAEYARLIAYIQNSFRYDAAGHVQHIKGHSYGPDDAFYEAKRVYSFLYTCNTWTNDALKASGQKACLWTPSDRGMFYQYGH
ncbi:urease-associated protein [Hymenobacter sedentarius]|uniref:Urease-associated protein n=1 Tax=Hymenobacter sedentarius TaxID=1411621 RepID=A0A0U4BTQ5_9BACT|nr:TIGR02117 family protein [Hymenobacter sedentarius]ALW86807.1 urease-associated protein [Hymenobacter sedentarius]